ncbi:hypothetical protein [Bradyrhizobium sp. URHC0002]
MSTDPCASEAGIVLPPGLLQPFLLRFRREDLHIMAFFSGHPDYEAVEAMISCRADGTPSIRAILTRHDQSQIDHVNDDDLSAEGHGVARQTCRRDIVLAVDAPPGRRHARLEFRSHADEPVVLDITTVDEPDFKRGGVSDPGSHSPNTSLPLMRRRASTLAGPQTAVFVGDKRFEVPVKISAGPFVAHEGYFTEGHLFGAIRAGTISYRLKTRPARMSVGEQWILEGDGRVIIYRIESNKPDGRLRIARMDTPAESIEAFAAGDGLRITRIGSLADGKPQGGLDLAFDEAGRFSLAMEGETIVSGSAATKREAGAAIITLSPTQPDWAVARQVRVACSRDGDLLTAVTTIGRSQPAQP